MTRNVKIKIIYQVNIQKPLLFLPEKVYSIGEAVFVLEHQEEEELMKKILTAILSVTMLFSALAAATA